MVEGEQSQDMQPRAAGEEKSIKGKIMKMHTKIWHLRDVTRKLLEGKRGGLAFAPVITEEELRQYCIDGTVSL